MQPASPRALKSAGCVPSACAACRPALARSSGGLCIGWSELKNLMSWLGLSSACVGPRFDIYPLKGQFGLFVDLNLVLGGWFRGLQGGCQQQWWPVVLPGPGPAAVRG